MFDFSDIATKYDDFYSTDLGKDIDIVEKRLVRSMIEPLPRNLSLEIGCGTGHWTEFFSSLGFPLIAIDISEKMVQVAQAKDISQAMFFVKDAENMDFRDNYFTNVFAITALEFMDNLDRAISQIYRVLKTGGYFFVGALNANSPYIKSKMERTDSSIAHSHPFTPETLRSLLSVFGRPEIKAGLVIEEGKIQDRDKEIDEQVALSQGAFLVGVVQKTK